MTVLYWVLAVWTLQLTDGLYTTSFSEPFLLRLSGFRYWCFCKNKYIMNVRKTIWEYKVKGKNQRGTWMFCKCLQWGYVPSRRPAPLASMSEECKRKDLSVLGYNGVEFKKKNVKKRISLYLQPLLELLRVRFKFFIYFLFVVKLLLVWELLPHLVDLSEALPCIWQFLPHKFHLILTENYITRSANKEKVQSVVCLWIVNCGFNMLQDF